MDLFSGASDDVAEKNNVVVEGADVQVPSAALYPLTLVVAVVVPLIEVAIVDTVNG